MEKEIKEVNLKELIGKIVKKGKYPKKKIKLKKKN